MLVLSNEENALMCIHTHIIILDPTWQYIVEFPLTMDQY